MKKSISQVIIAVTVAAGLTLGAAGTVTAQGKPATPPAARVRRTPAPKPSNPSNTFRGVATKLGTTPEAMESAYQTALQANPKLTRGHFVAANVLAQNLSSKYPAVTTNAILSGLQSGKSIGQTLQSLGLSTKEARDAQRQADRDAKGARRAAADSAHKAKTP